MENPIRRNDSPRQSSLRRAAFGLLGATTRDNRQHIFALEEEKSLSLDPEQCAKARQNLTSPRSRLTCEIEWLPGVSPKRATDYCDYLDHDLAIYFKLTESEHGLVRANLLAAGLEMLSEDNSASYWFRQILAFVMVSDEMDPKTLMVILNEDRALAECAPIQSDDSVENALGARLRVFKDVIRTSLDRMDTTQMLCVIFNVVNEATESGNRRGPPLLDEVIDGYSLDARDFLEKEAENVTKIVETAKAAADQIHTILPLLDKLDKVISNWTEVAKPIQMSMKSRGLVHDLSSHVGYTIRSLVLTLVREANDIASAQKITVMLQEHFSQHPELADLIDNDVKQLNEMARTRSFDDLLIPIRTLCKEAAELADSDPTNADKQGQRIISFAPEVLMTAERNGVPADILAEVKDGAAYAISSCAIDFGNKTSKWKLCLTMLEAANIFASGSDALAHVQKNLEIVRQNVHLYGDLLPIDSAPSLFTFNGCGVKLYGNTEPDNASGSYMATYYLVLVLIPIFPICRYRVISTGGNGYRFLGKGRLRLFDKWHIAILIGIILFMFLQK